jgi:hypothetical protein
MSDFAILNRLLLSEQGKLDKPLYELLERLIKAVNTIQTDTSINPGWRVFNSANISIPNNTDTMLTFDSETYDDGYHKTTVQNNRITIKSAGRYNIGANIEWANLTIGTRVVYFLLNSTTIIAATEWAALRMSLSMDYAFIAGDYIEVWVKQNSGGALNVVATAYSPVFYGHGI